MFFFVCVCVQSSGKGQTQLHPKTKDYDSCGSYSPVVSVSKQREKVARGRQRVGARRDGEGGKGGGARGRRMERSKRPLYQGQHPLHSKAYVVISTSSRHTNYQSVKREIYENHVQQCTLPARNGVYCLVHRRISIKHLRQRTFDTTITQSRLLRRRPSASITELIVRP